MSSLMERANGRRRFGTAVLLITGLFMALAAATGPAKLISADDPTCDAMPPGLIGYAPSHFGNAVRIDVQGDYAYLVDWSGSLEVFDISDPCLPVSLGSAQWTDNEFQDVTVEGDYAYVANDADGLAKYDVSNSAAPLRISARKDGGGFAASISYDGGIYAYVGQLYSTGTELAVYNMATFPKTAPAYYSPGAGWPHLWEVHALGERAYISAGDGKGNTRFQILDVKYPSTGPRLIGTLDLPLEAHGSGFAIEVQGDFAYLAALDVPQHDGGLVVVNIAREKYPFVQGAVTIPNSGVVPWKMPGLDAFGDQVYMMGRDGLVGFDVSDPSHPAQAVYYPFPASFGEADGGDVIIQGDLAITAVARHDPPSAGDHGGIAIYKLPVNDPLIQDQVTLVSTDEAGNQGIDDSWDPDISGDGHFAVFASNAYNLWGGEDYEHELKVKDLVTGEYVSGVAGHRDDDLFHSPAISADGNTVAYAYTNLDGYGPWGLGFLDRLNHKLFSIGLAEEYDPALSADGRYMAFTSYTPGLVPGDDNGKGDVFVYDHQTRQIEPISYVAGPEGQIIYGDGDSYAPSISADGRYVAFETEAKNLGGDCDNVFDYIMVHDRVTGQTTAAATSCGAPDAFVGEPDISADGRYVAYVYTSTDPGGLTDDSIVVTEWQTRKSWLIRFDFDERATEVFNYDHPQISADGTFVTFISKHIYGVTNVFLYDHSTKQIRLVSASPLGNPGNGRSRNPAISDDGRYVIFESLASNLVDDDTNGKWDVFVYDRQLFNGPRGSSEGIISAGEYHSCALRPDGRADCWGAGIEANDHGQAQDQAGPFIQLGTGALHSCGLRPNGSVDCWGSNIHGQAEDQAGPFIQIAVDGDYACGLRPDGSVDCWGRSNYGQAVDQAGPYVQISAGWTHTCGLAAGGSIFCWGDNSLGQAENKAGPFVQVSVGSVHTCALKPNGDIDCWGRNYDGEAEDQSGPFIQIAAGGRHSCALKEDGSAACWGLNSYGQAEGQTGPYVQISAGGTWMIGENDWGHTCGLKPDGSVDCWGSNADGQAEDQAGPYGPYVPETPAVLSAGGNHTCGLLPDGSVTCWGEAWASPLANQAGEDGPFTAVDAGFDHACGLSPQGKAACWGANNLGQAAGKAGPFLQLSAGADYNCGLKFNGSVDCWGGDNDAGETVDQAGPFTQVSAGTNHNCAIKPDGSLFCWGANEEGQSDYPAGAFQQISAGKDHSCALTAVGNVDCWGLNADGQAGDPLGLYRQVSAGSSHSCALKLDGSVACWGNNEHGQAAAQAGPFTRISAGDNHTCGLTLDGRVLCWGDNQFGQAQEKAGPFGRYEPPPLFIPLIARE